MPFPGHGHHDLDGRNVYREEVHKVTLLRISLLIDFPREGEAALLPGRKHRESH